MNIILLEKITGGPSGPLAIIYFFQKKRTYKHTNTKTHKQTNRLGQKTPLSSTRDQWPVIAMGQREESGMQLDLSSPRSLDPELHPLFLGRGDTLLLHSDPGD